MYGVTDQVRNDSTEGVNRVNSIREAVYTVGVPEDVAGVAPINR